MDSEFAFNISVLVSGSTSSSLFIETNQKRVSVDVDLSGKKITSLLAEVNRKPEDLDAVLVIHEYRDHTHGVGVLARKYRLDAYANEKTRQAVDSMTDRVDVAQKHTFEMGKVLTLGGMDIESSGVPHDAIAPQFYRFHCNNRSFVILADMSHRGDYICSTIGNADAYLVESNHETEILRTGPYPRSLKRRILGDKGRSPNDDGAPVMADVSGGKTKCVHLGYLSKENNTKLHAQVAMESTLKRKDSGVNEAFRVYDIDPDPALELF